MTEPIYIYALFAENRECLYVGATVSPHQRRLTHQTALRRRKSPHSETFTLEPLRTVWSDGEARRHEERLIAFYKGRNEAKMNRRLRSGFSARAKAAMTHEIVETGQRFRNARRLAEHLGCSRATVTEAIKKRGGVLYSPQLTIREL